MISSMTGYGRGAAACEGREVTVELKSVNHRYLDLGIRLPRHITFVEETLRSVLNQTLARGHVDVFVFYRNTRNDARSVSIDLNLMENYLIAARAANETLQVADDLSLSKLLRLPDVSTVIEAEEDRDAVCELVRQATLDAVTQLKHMRAQEGERLSKDLTMRVNTVLSLVDRIEKRAPLVIEEYKAKLDERVQALVGQVEVDRMRLATEVAIFADKASIDEEIVRLKSHAAQMLLLLAEEEPSGRRLDFIVQEMNREFNTIGSKANDGELVKAVLSGKAEIEKFREQVQNIE